MTPLRFMICALIGVALTWLAWSSMDSPPSGTIDWLIFVAVSALTGTLAFMGLFTRTWWHGGIARGSYIVEPRWGNRWSIRSAWSALSRRLRRHKP